MKQVILYSKDYCPYCTLAKNILNSLNIAYEEIDITHKPETIYELMKKSGMRTVPQIFIGEELIGGYDDLSRLYREGKLLEKLID
jgi:glutaredoxin 3